MKKTLLLTLLLIGAATFNGSAQEPETEIKKEEQEAKEVRVEELNGVKTVTVITSENGHPKEEIYTGAAAEQKLAELEKEQAEPGEGKKIEVEIKEEGGRRKMKVTTVENGEETVEFFEGDEIDVKLKELEEQEKKDGKATKKMLVKKRKVVEKSVD